MDVLALADRIERDLRDAAVPGRAEQEKAYLKSSLTHLGVPVPAIRTITVGAVRDLDRASALALVGELWSSGIHELRQAAIETLVRRAPVLAQADLVVAEGLIRDSDTWAYVDPLATKVVGDLVLRFPALSSVLDAWARDPDFWIRRTALLALLPGVRLGDPDLARISAYGDLYLTEREFFIRKALGWTLRELSRRDPAWVDAWISARLPHVSGVTFREAIKYLPEARKTALQNAYRSR